MAKGFTFAQMATLILVIMGLTIVVVLAATQLARLSGQTTDISQSTDVTGATEALTHTGNTCRLYAGVCSAAGTCTGTEKTDGTGAIITDCPLATPQCC